MKVTRRNRVDLMTPAELAIREAMLHVEGLGCSTLLTEAVVLLGQAQDKVADFMDLVNVVKAPPVPDGHVHTMPTSGPEHAEGADCWCGPELRDDFTASGGRKHYLHRNTQ